MAANADIHLSLCLEQHALNVRTTFQAGQDVDLPLLVVESHL